jgi:flagellar basal body-associated protein FliL
MLAMIGGIMKIIRFTRVRRTAAVLAGTLTLQACGSTPARVTRAIKGTAPDPGSAWPWLLLVVVVLVAVGLGITWFVHMNARRRNWPALAMSAYGQGTSLVTALKSGRQTQVDFDIGADGYATRLNQLQRDAPQEEARWVIARVSTALDDVRGAVADHPGTQTVRAAVRILEGTLEELRTAAYDANPPIE